jgi:hypothetical protein
MFILWKAVTSLKSSGLLATVLPSPLLDSEAALPLREAMSSVGDLDLIGRFSGFGYFRGAAVEPAFLVYRRGTASADNRCIQLVIADEGSEDFAIRGLRRDPRGEVFKDNRWEVFQAPADSLESASWRPRRRATVSLVERMKDRGMPRVGGLFDVQMGARLGAKDVFLLSHSAFDSLPNKERRFFRPAAGTGSIASGVLQHSQYVFYPYSHDGAAFSSEEELRGALPVYFRRYLEPARTRLSSRARTAGEPWWQLARARTWQWHPRPKLVSAYFVDAGSFVYDPTGDCVVVQGFAWNWRETDDCSEEDFHQSPLPWAYLAILNSFPFIMFLAHFCPRVRGGQFDASKRFVDHAFLPNLTDDEVIAGDMVADLAKIGREFATHGLFESEVLASLVARAYRSEPSEFAPDTLR